MNSFRNMIGPCRYLARDEELELMRRWQLERDAEARLALFRGVFPLMLRRVNAFCRRYGRTDFEEFESAACCGVLRAIDLFDPARGCRLSTYAMWGARTFMERQLAKRVIQVPENFLRQKTYRAEIERALATLPFVYHGAEKFEHAELSYCDRQPEEPAPLWGAIDQLTERERLVIVGWFFEQRTLADIGAGLGVTRERARQIKEQALDRLRELLEPAAAA